MSVSTSGLAKELKKLLGAETNADVLERRSWRRRKREQDRRNERIGEHSPPGVSVVTPARCWPAPGVTTSAPCGLPILTHRVGQQIVECPQVVAARGQAPAQPR